MKSVRASTKESERESHPYLSSVIALILIVLCLWASQWQYQRGVDRHHRNAFIAENASGPAVNFELSKKNINKLEWRTVIFEGKFDPGNQILLRNKYNEGKYGFDLLTIFNERNGRAFWVNRGWIAPGATAKTAPKIPTTPTTNVKITGRLRLDNSLPQGSFFAMPSDGGSLVEKWNAQLATTNNLEVFYVDLIKSSNPQLTPVVPAALPELSDGPHMAYALQWIFFGGLVVYGRILLRRSAQVLTSV